MQKSIKCSSSLGYKPYFSDTIILQMTEDRGPHIHNLLNSQKKWKYFYYSGLLISCRNYNFKKLCRIFKAHYAAKSLYYYVSRSTMVTVKIICHIAVIFRSLPVLIYRVLAPLKATGSSSSKWAKSSSLKRFLSRSTNLLRKSDDKRGSASIF